MSLTDPTRRPWGTATGAWIIAMSASWSPSLAESPRGVPRPEDATAFTDPCRRCPRTGDSDRRADGPPG